jgi:transposase-like protein
MMSSKSESATALTALAAVREAATDGLRGALRTTEAALYLGCSAELLKKWRQKKPKDPGEHGPPWSAVTSRLILYRIVDLDAWLEARAISTRAKSNYAAEVAPA